MRKPLYTAVTRARRCLIVLVRRTRALRASRRLGPHTRSVNASLPSGDQAGCFAWPAKVVEIRRTLVPSALATNRRPPRSNAMRRPSGEKAPSLSSHRATIRQVGSRARSSPFGRTTPRADRRGSSGPQALGSASHSSPVWAPDARNSSRVNTILPFCPEKLADAEGAATSAATESTTARKRARDT